ncbi:DUF1835 domain-containing protein [Mangrovimonas sp. YM274]|uniref:DUF1835 domain-containing protein n=1 Tax=Mangrovimonas sp. YM274 TaxID=3070660 RepID=UPI0027DDC283|nr:DUF1835 domain-containing protein [Mangrovimonas sp. YM274]WMI67366.1 DUF1835 domain-containing protein [Mangrovimonas sp. YM274]
METLHITNGGQLTKKLLEHDITGDILTWDEMLCEGPTTQDIDSKEFVQLRKEFFRDIYDLEFDEKKFYIDINKLNQPENYSEIILWFEYDLFCHINLIAVLSLILQKKMNLPLYLVCSGRVEGEKNLKGLSELTQDQLFEHYDSRVKLKDFDINLGDTLWSIYCGKDHNLLKPFITTNSSFEYLSNCLKAHLERFPDSKSGLSVLEQNILIIVRDNTIKSRHHLLGYILNYQGYYGFGDIQINRLIEHLSMFFDEKESGISLNRKGHEAILNQYNFAMDINNNIWYGGVNRLDFQFSKQENKLIKTPINAL